VLTGADAAFKWKISERISLNSKVSYIYAKDVDHNDVLIYIPPAQMENGVTYSLPSVGKLQNFHVGLSVPTTFRQHQAPMVILPENIGETSPEKTFDFAPAPQGYSLVNARVGFKLPLGEHALGIILSGENLMNKSYRNYMNRLRYYADDTGVNFMIRLSYNFLSHD
jgi:iron complex outermembrane receptor protein